MNRYLYTTSLLLCALVLGVFWGTWFTLTRSIEGFSATEFIHIGKTIIANVAGPMRILMPACLVTMGLSVWQLRRKGPAAFAIALLAFVLMIITLIITVGVEVPIDNQIKTWTAETIPSNFEALRTTWRHFHTARTFTAMASFLLYACAPLRSRLV